MTEHSTTTWVLQSQLGCRKAYARLIQQHYKTVFLASYAIIGDEHQAEDAAQEAFLKGFTKIRTLKDPNKFDAWICKIARNHSISLARKNRKHLSLNDQTAQLPDTLRQNNQDLHHAIQQLPLDLRMPLVMYYFDGRKVPQVAQSLGISASNVYTKLKTAVTQLRQHIQQGEQS